MDFYFPIADFLYSPLAIISVGVGVGFISGLLGLGSGILITPILLLIGFPSRIAVASQVNASIGSNFIGMLNYGRRRDIDYALGSYLIVGGLCGALTEFYILQWLYDNISPHGILRFITGLVLIILSFGMFYQIIKSLLSDENEIKHVTMKEWMIYIPFHKVFLRSRTEISILIPLVIGFLTGILTVSLGGGINTMMLPFLTYLIGRVSPCVTGTSFFVSTVIFICVTFLHGLNTAPVDMMLVFFLSFSTSIGSKLGVHISFFFSRLSTNLITVVIVFFLGVKSLMDVSKLSQKRPKIILNNGVQHYLDDLYKSMPENIDILSRSILKFANFDPLIYCLTCILLSIGAAYIVDVIMKKIIEMR